MNIPIDPTKQAAVATPALRQIRVVTDEEPILDTARFEHMQRIANVMARCELVPKSLRGGKDFETAVANCFLVVNQSVRWGMDPFAVAQCASVIQGKLCYEGKLVAAVMQKNGVNLSFKIEGTGDAMSVVVSGTLPGENENRTVTGAVAQWKTNNDQWRKDPRAMLCYRGARAWSRIHNPAPMLGVWTPDEFDEDQRPSRATRDITPRDDGPPAPPAARLSPPATVTDPVELVESGRDDGRQVEWGEHGETAAPSTADLDDIPAACDRRPKPQIPTDEFANWRKDTEGALAGCEDAASLHDVHTKIMLPAKGKVFPVDWQAVAAAYKVAFDRISLAA